MLFHSLRFLGFFPAVVLLYYILPHKARKLWLLIASYYYYICWDWRFLIFLLFSTISTWYTGTVLECTGDNNNKTLAKKLSIALCVIINVGILAVLKYGHFVIATINYTLGKMGGKLIFNEFSLLLPVGISFYTLQVVGYLIDVYNGRIPAERNILNYSLFAGFFPQILSGPIGRGKDLLPQYDHLQDFDYNRVRRGLLRMLWGLFVKLVITERLGIIVDTVFADPQKFAGFTCVMTAAAYGLQIYCDFSSYSNIALGAAEVLGIRLMENFKTPYFSQSAQEFWRRWHISLSTWFRDYIYFPLGGSRVSRLKKYRNILIVFALSGLWHGADWTFVIWGLLNGMFQVVEDLIKNTRFRIEDALHIERDNLGNRFFRMLLTFCLIDFAWIFFRADTMRDALCFIERMFTYNPEVLFDGSWLKLGLDAADCMVLSISLLIHLVISIFNYNGIIVRDRLLQQGVVFRWLLIYLGLFSVLVFGMYGPSYQASNFIYMQF